LQPAGIRCRVDLPENPPNRPLSPEARHNMLLATKEALNNIARHSGANEVWLRVKITDENMEVRLEDNGLGFDTTPKNGWADGLRNMRHRMEDIGGEFHVQSKLGSGTKISLVLPLAHR